MPEAWYIRDRNKVMGPFDRDQLDVLRRRGQLARFHEVSQDRKTWSSASSLSFLFGPASQPSSKSADPVQPTAPTVDPLFEIDLDSDPRAPGVPQGITSPTTGPARATGFAGRSPREMLVPVLGCAALIAIVAAVLLFLGRGGDADQPHRALAQPRNRQPPLLQDAESHVSEVIVLGGFTLLFIAGAGLYMLPTIIAASRGHQNTAAIAALNILLGCIFIGWVAALVWSLTEVTSRDHYHYHER